MATCKHCGNTLILNNGKCMRCGKSPNDPVHPIGDKALGPDFPPTKTFIVNGISFKMILVEGGSFYYGLNIDLLKQCIENGLNYKDMYPLVKVDSFYIGETPVTQALWEAVMEERDDKIVIWDDGKVIYNPSRFKGKELPVDLGDSKVYINSYSVFYRFVDRLNLLTSVNFRLPDNYEWEYAAKGGTKTKGYKYSGSDNLDEVAWYSGNSGKRIKRGVISTIRGDIPREVPGMTHVVKTKKPNELGIYDMSGNVGELVNCEHCAMALRGGGWSSEERFCLTTASASISGVICEATGFRLALNSGRTESNIQNS